MKSIETIEEIRKVRMNISEKCDFDPKKLVAFYIKRQQAKNKHPRAQTLSSKS